MSDVVIRVENLSKQYRLGKVGAGTIRDDLNRFWAKLRGREDPMLKIGQTNALNASSNDEISSYVWALQDINFEVKKGEVWGIIGKNGAGKSTLLKILSKVTTPTTGLIQIKGRIASLLEVGTGFHAELSGRENIFLNGAILGMTKAEVKSKFDEIVNFSGIERYIDTPVKRYSSGMYVRLAFAVAAHLEPEILVVDEVLAVGDAEFQKKAIGKMQDVSHSEGRTVLFVSHNMAAVKSLCSKGIILANGKKILESEIDNCVSTYLKGNNNVSNHCIWKEKPEYQNEDVELLEVGIRTKGKNFESQMSIDEPLELFACFRKRRSDARFDITFHVKDENGNRLFSTGSGIIESEYETRAGTYMVSTIFPANFFNWGSLYFDLMIVKDRKKAVVIANDVISCTLSNVEIPIGAWMGREPGAIMPKFQWEQKKLDN